MILEHGIEVLDNFATRDKRIVAIWSEEMQRRLNFTIGDGDARAVTDGSALLYIRDEDRCQFQAAHGETVEVVPLQMSQVEIRLRADATRS